MTVSSLYEKIASKLRTRNALKFETALLCLVIVISAWPFLNQPLHIDDPVFLQSARDIIHNPLDPYSSVMNWNGKPEKLFDFSSNPPLLSYYLAGVIAIWGESERAMHLSCIPFSLLAGVGMYFLSRRFGVPALVAALFFVLSPIFLTMSHTLMPDVAMCAFAILGILFFIRGYDQNRPLYVFVGAFLAGIAPLFRYNGLIAPLLMGLYILLNFRQDNIKYMAALFIPASLFLGWNLITLEIYGAMHFLHHLGFQKYGSNGQGIWGIVAHFLPHLIFIAAGFPLLFLFMLWHKKDTLVALRFAEQKRLRRGKKYSKKDTPVALRFACYALIPATILTIIIQRLAHYTPANLLLVFMFAYGASVFVIIVVQDFIAEWKSGFPRDSAFLVIWLLAILWMQNSGVHAAAKYMITSLPPVIVLALRHFGQLIPPRRIAAALVFTTILGVITATADYRLAHVYKKMAHDATERTGQYTSPKYFTGHWGFQYYMEKAGASSYSPTSNAMAPAILSGVALAWPQYIPWEIRTNMVRLCQKKYNDKFPFRTMSNTPGYQANFYTFANYLSPVRVVYGVLPFSFSRAPLEALGVFELQ